MNRQNSWKTDPRLSPVDSKEGVNHTALMQRDFHGSFPENLAACACGEIGPVENSPPPSWEDFDGEDERRHYTQPQVNRCQYYEGPLSHLEEHEALNLMARLLDYFHVSGFGGISLPPTGLPGLNRRVQQFGPPYKLVTIGWEYFLASVRGQGRAMHNRWRDAEAMLRAAHDAGREEMWQEICERERAASADRGSSTKEQFVYFIASESGPIKIGIAANPVRRCKELQTSHHEKLDVLVTCAGGQRLEAEYHRRFAEHRLHGEWFERVPAILAEIERLSA